VFSIILNYNYLGVCGNCRTAPPYIKKMFKLHTKSDHYTDSIININYSEKLHDIFSIAMTLLHDVTNLEINVNTYFCIIITKLYHVYGI